MSFSENVAGRFEAYGWHYVRVEDGNDLAEIAELLKKQKQRPQNRH